MTKMKKANEQRGHQGRRERQTFLLLSLLALVLPRLPRLSACNQQACRSTILREETLELRKILQIFLFFLHQCSATCGSGMMTRQIMCLSPGKVARPLSEEKCSAATRPQSHKVCKTQECSTLYKIDHEGDLDDHYWRLSMWTPVMFLATTCCCCRMRSNTMQCFSLKLKKQ